MCDLKEYFLIVDELSQVVFLDDGDGQELDGDADVFGPCEGRHQVISL